MNKKSSYAFKMWHEIKRMFPPRVSERVTLYRLVTVPLKYVDSHQLTFRPAVGRVRRWSNRLVGLERVMGVARDFNDNAQTCRLGVRATMPGSRVLATTATIRTAFMALRHDYVDRYPEQEERRFNPESGHIGIFTTYPGYPGGDDPRFKMHDIGFYRDVVNRPGGTYRQYEWVVETPPRLTVDIIRIYRRGNQILRPGNDAPHD